MSTAPLTRAEIYGQSLKYFFQPVAKELYSDDSVTEVLINGPNDIYVERRGKLERLDRRFPSAEALEAAVNNLAEYVDRRLDDLHHSMDARLPEPEKFRVHVIIPPCSRVGIVVSIRKFKRAELTLSHLVEIDTLSEPARYYLEAAVQLHKNLLVSGGTGSGKTSLLNALSAHIPDHERIIVIEDSSELHLRQPHTVYLEARPPQADGRGGVTIRDLFVDSLRMRPDRIIVGEVRRGEALDLVQSMLSGHDGSMSTVHASSPRLALVRLETLCMMSDVDLPVYVARTQVASAIQVLVQIARVPSGARQVLSISEVVGLDERDRYQLVDVFRRKRRHSHRQKTDPLENTGERSLFAEEVHEYGFPEALRHCGDVFRIDATR
jgi:pilus assembly protein CpaF